MHTVQFGAPGPGLDCRYPNLDNLETGKAFYAQHLRQEKQPNILTQGLHSISLADVWAHLATASASEYNCTAKIAVPHEGCGELRLSDRSKHCNTAFSPHIRCHTKNIV